MKHGKAAGPVDAKKNEEENDCVVCPVDEPGLAAASR
jgi:hypothetical protein